ncbi:MAG: hypothetical protein ACI4ME_11235 [Aristaeellaceae bacterium]
MKRWWTALFALMMIIMLLPAARAEEPEIPAEILSSMLDWYPSAEVEDYAELPDVGGGPMAFLLIRQDGRRLLRTYRQTENGWRWENEYSAAIPQGNWPDVGLSVRERACRAEDSIWFDPDRDEDVFPEGPLIGVYTSDGECIMERVEYVWEDGAFRLLHYGDDPLTMVDVAGDELIFYSISSGYKGRTYALLDRAMEKVDYGALPRNLADVRIMGDSEPPLPESVRPMMMDQQPFLEKQNVTLQPGSYAVHAGPGERYDRAGTLNWQTAEDASPWVQVFGEYEGWLLIHYGESGERYRFGWIPATALAPGQVIRLLRFRFGDIVTAEPDSPLTDDPLNSRTPLTVPGREAEIEYLAQLGENFSYVRATVDGKTWWGFVYTWTLGHG